MSNLSELLPTGGGQNAVDFVASGTLSSGQTVVLNSDGTVEAVGATTVPSSVGTATTFDTGYARFTSATYDSGNNKVVVAYSDGGNSSYGTAVVGTVSGTSISFGTPVVFEAAVVSWVSIVYAETSGKVVISYVDGGNSSYGTAIVGTVSGTSISFGTAAVYHSVTVGEQTSTYSSHADKVIVWYQNGSDSSKGYASSGVVSGTSITFASNTLIENAGSVDFLSVIAVPNSNTVVFSYRYNVANNGYSWNWTISGTGFTSNNYALFSGTPLYISTVWDSSANKMILAYRKGELSNYGVSYVADVTATDVTFGTEVVFNSGTTIYTSTVFDQNINKPIILYQDISNSGYGTLRIGTVSGTSISFGSEFVFNNSDTLYNSAVYSTTDEKIVIAYADDVLFAKGAVFTPSYVQSNSADFIGITAEAISNTATGAVNVYGGINEAQTGLTIGSDYYVQANGSLSTTASSVKVGQAISATTINMMDLT